jgi:mono/diheme cytochrome c family protein
VDGQNIPSPAAAPKALVWDKTEASSTPKPDEKSAAFTFRFENRSGSEIIIQSAKATCGCTVAALPHQPWRIAPGAKGELMATMDVGGKAGRIAKLITVETSEGHHRLTLVADLPPPPFSGAEMMPAERIANVELAKANRQAIFQGDCRSCHVDRGEAKLGRDLYLADCSICHEASQRAAMVPDLRTPNGPRNLSYWHHWISEGHPGSLMPAFAASEGGPLSQQQINSLVTYLVWNYPDGKTAPAVLPVVSVSALPPAVPK